MANEFKIKNGLVVDQGGAQITGSVQLSGSINDTIYFSGSGIGIGDVPNSNSSITTDNDVYVRKTGGIYLGTTDSTTIPARLLITNNAIRHNTNNSFFTISGDNLGSDGANMYLHSRRSESGSLTISTGPGGITNQEYYFTYLGLGIGQQWPSYKLHVNGSSTNGSLNVDNTLYVSGSRVGIGTTSPYVRLTINDDQSGPSEGSLWITSQLRLGVASTYAWFQSHGNKPLAINPLGNNVGISTSTPSEKLEVNGNLKLTNNQEIYTAGAGARKPWRLYADGGDKGALTLERDGVVNTRISSDINVFGSDYVAASNPSHYFGIGTTTPNQKLTVSGSINIISSNSRLLFGGYRALEGTQNGSFLTIGEGYGSTTIKNGTTINGDLDVTGKVTAQEFHTEFVSSSIIYESGSTKFGDSSDDVHQFTGSIRLYSENGNNVFTLYASSSNSLVSNQQFKLYDEFNSQRFGLAYNNSATYLSSNNGGLFLNRFGEDTYIGDYGSDRSLSVKYSNGRVGIKSGNTSGSPLSDLYINGNLAVGVRAAAPVNGAVIQGNVGIGTISPSYKLHVSASAVNNTVIGVNNYLGNTIITLGDNSGSGLIDIKNSTGTSDLIKLNGGGNSYINVGNVGIGTTSPRAKLDIQDSTHGTLMLSRPSESGYAMISGSSGLGFEFKTYDAGEVMAMKITNSGNVGIGTTIPSQKLEVNGNILATSAVTSSQLIVSSSGTAVATIQGSGSSAPIFEVVGSQGQLFSVVDSFTGSLFSINDISGLPLFDVDSSETITIGDFTDPAIVATGSNAGFGTSTPQQRLHVSGTALFDNILALTPQDPLPTGVLTGSFAVSASAPPKPYFYDGTNWNALY